jgi:hypothetical protein
VFVDYVQDVDFSQPGKPDNVNHAHISKTLRKRAKRRDHKIAIVELSQLSNPPTAPKAAGKQAKTEDSAGSKQYAKDAGPVVSLERKRDEKDEKKRNTSSVRLLKNRLFGDHIETWMRWNPSTTQLAPSTKDGDSVTEIPVADPSQDDLPWGGDVPEQRTTAGGRS